MRRLAIVILSLVAVLGLASTASAASVHLKNRPPLTFTDQGETLNATGALTGLGNADLVVALTATGTPTVTCTNPAGETQPPGQNPAEITLGGLQEIPASSIKNGNVAFNVSTVAPQDPADARTAGCPGVNWTAQITDVDFSSATLTVYQPCKLTGGQLDDPTTPGVDGTCTVVLTRTVTGL